MDPVKTYRSLNYNLLLFGWEMYDLVVMGVILFIVHVKFQNLLITIALGVLCLYIGKKTALRPKGFFWLVKFNLQARRCLPIAYEPDGPSYHNVIRKP